ncbi:MAG: RiPP maturation radical SAM C-methyltransferase [Proteobacteria bacterium]|nr:RiPP maturation radical SAM C-methyltransferase [Pseudomonadota bacterium]MBU4068767.1 RiPP maturation radical SAM C-methyltransferase [Pseudomonadota bacterium]
MKPQKTNKCKDVILVSMPWSLFSRPSIQIGALKAYLKLRFPYINIAAHHFYLKVAETIGYELYHSISESTWLAETIYAAMLSPEKLKTIEKIFHKEAKNKPLCRKLIFKDLVSKVKKVTDAFIESINWNIFCLAGFSVSQCQLTSSLYIIKRLKTKYPELKIVLGGSTFAGASKEVFKLIPEIDFVAKGEGELPLSQLVHHLSISNKTDKIPYIKGIISRESIENDNSDMFYQMETLDSLPMPDFDDYFDLIQTFGSNKTFFPTISCEISRGCWWRHLQRSKNIKGCAFCNLNLQWDGYRSKSPSKVVSEVDKLTSKYKTLSVAFTDNALPVKESKEVFIQLKELKKNFRFFSEIRATTTQENLKIMHDAGMSEVQIGIESLSTRLLRKLNKGTTAIQNLEIMKNCEHLGIVNNSNLILQFPGSDMDDVEETLRNLEFATSFRPLRQVNFWLGLESPVWQNPQQFGIKALYNHPRYADLLPQNISSMRFLIQAYRGDLRYQKKLWKPVKQRIKAWKMEYESLHNNSFFEPILSFLDGRDFLIIIQKQFNDRTLMHRLKGKSREIYLFCQHYRSIKKILEHFPELSDDKIISFLRIMVSKKLMFEENEKYLSLAVPK